MAPKKGNDPPPAATPTGDSTGLPVFSDEALAAESFSLEAPFEDELGAKLPVGLSAGMIQWRRPSEFLSELLVEPAEGVEAVVPFVVQPPPPPAEGEEAQPTHGVGIAPGRGEGGRRVGDVGRGGIPGRSGEVEGGNRGGALGAVVAGAGEGESGHENLLGSLRLTTWPQSGGRGLLHALLLTPHPTH